MTMSHLTLGALLICFFITTKHYGIYGFSIKLIPIDRFDTMLFPKNLTLEERYQRIYEISRAHICQLESMVSLSSVDWNESIEDNANALQPVVVRSNLNYYVTTLSVGTHRYAPNLVVDTGSVDTWMQCEGCNHCFFIRQGNFNKSQSQSYRPLPCDDPLCVPRICENDICMYNRTYIGSGSGDSYSKGQLGSDTFIFNRGNIFLNTVFGCGLDNYNLGWDKSGKQNTIAGIFGLGLGKRSIFMQYVNETKNHISYCLPSYYARGAYSYTYLHFGDNAQIGRRHGIMTTGLIPNVSNYAVIVIDISINRKHLNIDPTVFQMKPDHTGGFMLDSGSPHTGLVQTAYAIAEEEIKRYFLSKYNWHPLPPRPGKLDLCYIMPHRNFTAPSMTYHFEGGASLFLPEKNVFHFFDDMFCWIVVPIDNRGPSILGALQQANYRFLFDFTALTVSFVPELCRFN